MTEVESAPKKRDEWEIREDYQAIRRAVDVMKDPERLKDVQEHIKSKKAVEGIVDAAVDGDLGKALGLMG
jgi:hypothetical protein